MENTEKKIVGVFSFLPLLAWIATIVYFLFINKELLSTETFQDHGSVVTNIIKNFLPFTILLSFAELITGAMVIYSVVHLARIKNMDAFNKILWIIFLVFLAPISVLVLWAAVINKESREEELYRDLNAVPRG